ncbi:hypothetical protein IG194_06490 [Pseudomonas sp. ADPe]|uniref:hypothetical protein n=1 Tax=Pseudomonas sp. ADPe TaxID=2774873 RepID=UPI00177B35FC|nr:hypothetical protein [Pseudomonas sp. ADPe]QOF86325.1 hypothetical protein IG194_06490 [Pseudomonas sp. ADPe]
MIENFWQLILASLFPGACLLLLILITIRIKDTSLKIIALIYTYPAIHLLYLMNGGEGVRIETTGLNYYSDYVEEAFWTYIASNVVFLFPLRTCFNKIYYPRYRIKVRESSFWIIFSLYAISAAIAHPWVIQASARREQFLLSNAFVALYIATFIILCISSSTKNSPTKKTLVAIIPLVLILAGERVNNILMLAALFLMQGHMPKAAMSNKQKLAATMAILVAISGSIIAGEIRDGAASESYILSAAKLLNYTTSIESLHVYLSGFWYIKNEGTTPLPILNILYSLIPLHPLGGGWLSLFLRQDNLWKNQYCRWRDVYH